MKIQHIRNIFAKKMLAAATAACVGFLPAVAQTDADTEAKADDIRLDEAYSYADITFVPADNIDEDILSQQALAELTSAVNELRLAAGSSELSPQQLYPITESMTYTTSGRKCIFLYIPTAKAVAFNPSAIDNVDAGRYAAPAAPAAPEAPAGGAAPVSPAPVAPEADGPVEERSEASAFTPALQPSVAAVAAEILAADNWSMTKLGRLIWEKQEEGALQDSGQASSLDEVPAGAAYIRIDALLKMQGLYAPYTDGVARDMKSLQPLNPADFDGCTIMWFY